MMDNSIKKRYIVFLVDDDPIFSDMVLETLSSFPSFTIYNYVSAEQCMRNLHINPDIIFIDHDFSQTEKAEKSGLDAIPDIRAALPNVQLIALTGQEDGELVFEFIKKGASDYIIKDEDTFENIELFIKEFLAEKDNSSSTPN